MFETLIKTIYMHVMCFAHLSVLTVLINYSNTYSVMRYG